jgi:hypothetical protein
MKQAQTQPAATPDALGRVMRAVVLMLLAGLVFPAHGMAISVSDFVKLQDQDAQTRELQRAINNVLTPLQKSLRSAVDAKGNPKTATQMKLDSERADLILEIMDFKDVKAFEAMILDAFNRQPTVDLEKVIIAYIIEQLKHGPAKAR